MRALAVLITSLALLPACATRTVHQTVVDSYGLEIKLRSQKPLFGATLERGFQHPAIISASRIASILRGIEIDVRKSEGSAIAERRTAIAESIVDEVALGLAEAFAKAGPDQSLVTLAQRKRMQKGLFNRKYLTSFVSYIEDDELYVFVSRVDWKIEVADSSKRLPEPWPNDEAMPFRIVANDVYRPAGPQGVRVDWRSPSFAGASVAAPERSEAVGGEGVADQLEDDELAATGAEAPTATAPEGGSSAEATAAGLANLSPAALRELADIEEAFLSGRIDEPEYQRQRGLVFERAR